MVHQVEDAREASAGVPSSSYETPLWLLKAINPILWPTATVRNSQNRHRRLVIRVNNAKWEAPEQETTGARTSGWPTVRCLRDDLSSPVQLVDEVLGRLGASLPIPRDCRPDIASSSFVVLNALRAH